MGTREKSENLPAIDETENDAPFVEQVVPNTGRQVFPARLTPLMKTAVFRMEMSGLRILLQHFGLKIPRQFKNHFPPVAGKIFPPPRRKTRTQHPRLSHLDCYRSPRKISSGLNVALRLCKMGGTWMF